MRKSIIAMAMLTAFAGLIGSAVESAAQSQWRQQLGVFRVGIMTGHRTTVIMPRIRPLRRLLQDKIGVRVELIPVRSHEELIRHMAEERLDYAALSATAFATTFQLCKCVEPLLVPARRDDSVSYRSVLLVRKGTAHSLADLEGKTVLVPGRGSFSGYLFPKVMLEKFGTGFGHLDWQIIDKKTARAAARAFAAGEGDAVFGWVQDQPRATAHARGQGDFVNELNRASDNRDLYRSVWTSEPLLHGPHTVRRSLAPQVKNILRKVLITLPTTHPDLYAALEPRYPGGLRRTDMDAFAPMLEVAKRVLNEQRRVVAVPKLRPALQN